MIFFGMVFLKFWIFPLFFVGRHIWKNIQVLVQMSRSYKFISLPKRNRYENVGIFTKIRRDVHKHNVEITAMFFVTRVEITNDSTV